MRDELSSKVAFHGDALVAVLQRPDPVLSDPALDGQPKKYLESTKRRKPKITWDKLNHPADLEFMAKHKVFAPSSLVVRRLLRTRQWHGRGIIRG